MQYIIDRLQMALDHVAEGEDCVYPHFTTSELKEQLALVKRACDRCGTQIQWAEICTGCIRSKTIEQYINQYLVAYKFNLKEIVEAAQQYLEMFSPDEDFPERARLRAATARILPGIKDD